MAISREDFFDDGFMSQFPELADMGVAEGLSEQEAQELQRLRNRSSRLQPMERMPARRSTRMAGNPFSWDITPTTNAAQDALVKGVNAIREGRRRGDPQQYRNLTEEAQSLRQRARALQEEGSATVAGGMELQFAEGAEGADEAAEELMAEADRLEQQARDVEPVSQRISQLEDRQEQAAEGQQMQMEMMQELYPELATKMMDLESNLKEQEVGHQQTMKEIEERTNQAIREYNQTTGGEGGSGGGDNPAMSVGVVTGFLGQSSPYIQSINNTIEQLEGQKEFADDPEAVDERITNMKEKRTKLQEWTSDAYQALSDGNLYDENLVGRLESIIGEPTGQGDGQDFNMVQDMMRRAMSGQGAGNAPSPSATGRATVPAGQDTVSSGVDW